MKGILEFQLPEETYEFRVSRGALDTAFVIRQIDNRLKSLIKHGCDGLTTRQLAEEIRDMLSETSPLE